MKDAILVGITGRSGSGKSLLSNYYRSLGYPVADGDVISREIMAKGSPCTAQLVKAFGPEILDAQGEINRKALAAKAFVNQESNQKLVAITHPFILNSFLLFVHTCIAAGNPIVFFDGAIIIGSIFEPYFNKLIVVTANQDIAVGRIMQRDKLTRQQALARLNAQLPADVMLQRADYSIANNNGEAEFFKRADAVLSSIITSYKKRP